MKIIFDDDLQEEKFMTKLAFELCAGQYIEGIECCKMQSCTECWNKAIKTEVRANEDNI